MKRAVVWAVAIGLVSLALGASAVFAADFGMPAWFFVFSQVWLWTVGLPAMLGVDLVTKLWGIPEWTTLPLWSYIVCASLVAVVLECGFFLLVRRILRRRGGQRI